MVNPQLVDRDLPYRARKAVKAFARARALALARALAWALAWALFFALAFQVWPQSSDTADLLPLVSLVMLGGHTLGPLGPRGGASGRS